MTARAALVLLVGIILAPLASADDRRSFAFDGATLTLPPAPEAYLLRAGAHVEVPAALLLDSATRATLRVDGAARGEGYAPGRLLALDGTPAWIALDNPDVLVPKGGIVSVEIVHAAGPTRGLLGGGGLVGGLLGGVVGGDASAPSRFVLQAAAPPAPPAPTPPAPTPSAPAPPAPAPTPPASPTPPAPAPTAPATPATPAIPAPSAPAPTSGASPDDVDDEGASSATGPAGGASNAAALRAALPTLRPNVPLPSVMMLAMLAVAALALIGLTRLGRR